MSEQDRDAPFLSRWSRRKLAAKGAPQDEPERAETTPEAPAAGEQGAAKTPPEVAPGGEDDAPEREWTEEDVERLGPDADYTVFLKAGVPGHIQRLALRKLWRSDPVLANLDGLVDYDDDYRSAATFGEKVASAWKSGRGYLEEKVGETGGDARAGPHAEEMRDETAEAGEATGPGEPDESDDARREDDEPAADEGSRTG